MKKYSFKKMDKKDEKQTRSLVNTVFDTLERDDFLIPWTEEQISRFFDDNYSLMFGAYDDTKLVAMSQIFTPREIEEEYYEILSIPKSESICELGGFLVLPEYRNKKIMTRLSKVAMDYFEKLDYNYIISTVHPENKFSNKIVQKLGFQFYSVLTTQSGFLRNLYWKKNDK